MKAFAKTLCPFIALIICCLFSSFTAVAQEALDLESPIFGIWENSTRFVEIAPDMRLRVILKPYYAFVYEDAGWIPCLVSEESELAASGAYSLSLSYPSERRPSVFSAVVLDDNSLYTSFYVKEGETSTSLQEDQVLQEDQALEEILSGFWICHGDPSGIKIYSEPPVDEFFCLYFEGSRYYKIRYWLTDARFRDIRAVFAGQDESLEDGLSVPKFLRRGDFLYTCITGTGTTLRNYEQGSWEFSEGAISFNADGIMFTQSAQTETIALHLSADSSIMALGEPQLKRSKVTDMDAEIAEHNSKRKPPRKPLLEFMDLDFRWDEIERIRQ